MVPASLGTPHRSGRLDCLAWALAWAARAAIGQQQQCAIARQDDAMLIA